MGLIQDLKKANTRADVEKRAKSELEWLYPGLSNAEITAIQRQRLEQAEATSIEAVLRTPVYKKFVSLSGRVKTYNKLQRRMNSGK